MKAIILAAWEGTRLRPLTNTIPKPLIQIFWKSILEHNMDIIYKFVSEIIIVVQYKKELFKEKFGNSYKWVKIIYHEQIDEKWTASALKWIKSDTDIFVINWDSIFEKDDLIKLLTFKWYWVLVKEVSDPTKYWIFELDKEKNIKKVVEKPSDFIWNLANLWVYKFAPEILEIVNSIKISLRWEYEITDAINIFVKKYPLKTFNIKWDFIDIWFSPDILTANSYFLNNINKSDIQWIVEEWVVIKWNIILEKWSILKSGTYIEWNCYIWKNTSIWPNTYLRWNTCIWNNCKIWNWVEIKNSTIWNSTNIAHLSYFWDSILWNNINVWWGYISANLRHDKANIKIMVKWKLVDTNTHKFWIIIWDNCKIWIKVSSMPWRTIENNTNIMPWKVIN
jgi:bifunctional UDP-N-acetylglucosamine pyrophosphorylase/glucosamine-1-phosphate N-acetyltransferase